MPVEPVSERHWFKIPSLLENMCIISNLGEFSLSLRILMYKLHFFIFGSEKQNFASILSKQIPWVELFFSSKVDSQQAEVAT